MKKIIALLLLMTFCTEATTFAATINNSTQMNNSTSQMNLQSPISKYTIAKCIFKVKTSSK